MSQSLVKELLNEVVEEEIVELLEEQITSESIDDFNILNKPAPSDEVVQAVAAKLTNEVLAEQAFEIAEGCLDGILAVCLRNSRAVRELNDILRLVLQELVEEIVLEELDASRHTVKQNEILESVTREVVAEECGVMAAKVLDHHRARVALLQFKQMQVAAANTVLDNFLLDAMLEKYTPKSVTDSPGIEAHESDFVMDTVMLEILLSQSLALHTCLAKDDPLKVSKTSHASSRPTDCIPLVWYQRKFTSAIAEDVVLSLLCDRLDEAMHVAEDNEEKGKAVALLASYVDDRSTTS